jgi:2,5-diketo-D-gluconate reductase A
MKANTEISLRRDRRMPALGLGTWQLTDDTAGTVSEALEQGYRLRNTSGDYGTQAGIGEAVARSGRHGVDLFIGTPAPV